MPRILTSITFFAALGLASGQDQVLTWKNSEALEGELAGAGETTLTWKSPLFAEPVEIAVDHLQSITRAIKPGLPDQPFAVTLHDGSRLFGYWAGLDADVLTLANPDSGEISIRRGAVREVERLSGGSLIWSGPFGTAAWEFAKPDAKAKTPPWRDAAGGGLRNVIWHEPATLPIEFPSSFEIDFSLKSPARPEFKIEVNTKQAAVEISTWGDELVLRRGNVYRRIHRFEDDDREIRLRLFWNSDEDSVFVCSAAGEILAKWKTAGDAEPGILQFAKPARTDGAPGLVLTNKGAGLELSRLRIRKWNGNPPRPNSGELVETGAELAGGAILAELPTSLDTGSLAFASRRIPLEVIDSVGFPTPELPRDSAKEQVRVQLADSTRFDGVIVGVDGAELSFQTEFSDEPVRVPTIQVSAINVPGEREEADFSELDILEMSGKAIHGDWRPRPGARLWWSPPGSVRPVPISEAIQVGAKITRAEPRRPWAKASALFHLASREIADAELESIEAEGEIVRLRGDHFEARELGQQLLTAIVLAPARIKPDGFTDSGWRVIGEVSNLAKPDRTRAGNITIQPGGGWGHAGFLQGNEIEFKLTGDGGYSALRVRLFCGDLDEQANSTDLVFLTSGNRVYFGHQATGQGQLRNQLQAETEPGQPVLVRITWDDEKTRATVEGVTLEVDQGKEAPRTGLGIAFEPTSMWNNAVQPVSFSHLRLASAPGFTWAPPVSAQAKEQALFLPRFRANRPPRHAVLAPNGDVLRGVIETATASQIAFRSGLDTIMIPRARAAAAVWLKPPREEDDPAETPAPNGESPHWLILGNGARFNLKIEDLGPEFVTGTSATLGKCRIPVDQIHAVVTAKLKPDPATLAFDGWRLEKAPYPAIPGEAGGSSESLLQKPAPEFTLKTLNGEDFNLADQKGSVVVLDFWATWCGPCVRAMPELREALAAIPSEKVKLITVNQGEAAAVIENFLKARGWEDLEVALDSNQAVGAQYGVEGIPHTVVIGPDGIVALVETGFRPGGGEAVANEVRKLLEPGTIE